MPTMRLMLRKNTKSSCLCSISFMIALAMTMMVFTTATGFTNLTALAQQKKQVTLTAMLPDNSGGNPTEDQKERLFQPAIQELRTRHPELDIKINYVRAPYNQTRAMMLSAFAHRTPVDLISIDQIWFGEFAQRGYLTDITAFVQAWGRMSDWYQSNLAGGVYKGRIYGIWAWTDIRGIWYWKDLLNQAGVDPNSLKTWDGYIASAKKLDDVLRNQRIQGAVLSGANYSPDLWYPYLWMLGGDIIKQKSGHPTKGTYWFPAYNSSAGVKAMEFIKAQVDAGIKPIKGLTDKPFVDHKVAVYITGSWLPGWFPKNQWPSLPQRVGLVPAFPVPTGINQSSTMMGGWELAIPQTSQNKQLAWELLTIMIDPKIISPWLEQNGFLPTQKNLGSGPQSIELSQTIPYYDKMMSMIPSGHSRTSVSEYPQIADNVREAIEDVYYGIKGPKQALDDAAAKSAKALGW
jgi:multiple sugar transport system substrate-binding protein